MREPSPASGGGYRDREPPSRGAHLLSGGDPDPGFVAEVREALLRAGPRARAGRRTAAVLWGFDMQVEPRTVEIDLPHGRDTSLPGARSSRSGSAVLWTPVIGLAPLLVPPPVDTVLACAAELPLAQAVVIADSALRTGRCRLGDLRAGVGRWRGMGGLAELRAVLRWCDPRSGSVLESLLRVLLCRAGLVPPRTQHVLRDEGTGLVHRVDFAWPLPRLVVEADGRRWHDPADRRDADRRRDNTCARLSWRVLRFGWAEIVHEPAAVVASVRAALAA
jgi:very-short-patch-repair endonuclease